MRELALNILDIAENSLRAHATLVQISVQVDDKQISIQIVDNGCGMSQEFLAKVTDPFATTRTTRKVGLGIPLVKMEAEMSGGTFDISSTLNVGTTVKATFLTDHIDRPPLGSLAETVVALLPDLSDTRLIFSYQAFGQNFTLDTDEVKAQLQDVPLCTPEVLVFLKQLIDENITTINGGIVL